jgi:hypothetical protein
MLRAFAKDVKIAGWLRQSASDAGPIRPGVIGSAVLHGLVALLVVYGMRASETPPPVPAVPVELVVLDQETTSPPEREKIAVPQQQRAAPTQQRTPRTSRPEPAKPDVLASLTPPTNEAPHDELQDRLEALAKLRQPDSDARSLDGSGVANRRVTSDGATPGPSATYSVRDFVRAQVERRWNLDLEELGAVNFEIAIRVVMKRDGTVTKAEIVDALRYKTDATFHSIALSARNAVLLSSPIALPAGDYDETMDLTLRLNPRDTQR